jgi:hypothetical protein
LTRPGPGSERHARVGGLELVYIACGYKHLVEGDFRLTAGHPPIAKLLIAMPLVPLGLAIPDLGPDEHIWSWSSRFVHEMNDADRIMLLPIFLLADWGQDLPRLASWMNSHSVDKIQLAYFGRDDPGRFHIRHRDLPGGHSGEEGLPQNPFRGGVVISPGILFSPQPADEHYAQLAGRPPDDRAGAFFVYHLGEDVPSR